MPPTFDREASSLKVGLEVEYPIARGWEPEVRFTQRGRDSSHLASRASRGSWPMGAGHSRDPSVGLEVESPVLDIADAWKWYADVIDIVEDEYGEPHAPTGLIDGNTAGLHIHLSPLTRQEAKRLYELSETAWAKAFFCSGIVTQDGNNEWPVFRCPEPGGFCRFDGFDSPVSNRRYQVVNHRGGDHWEWRLPEPMTTEHMEHVVEFLVRFKEDPELAIQYAEELLNEGNDEITAIKRAEMVGMDITEQPIIERSGIGPSESFYGAVEDAWELPEIHRVSLGDEDYYVFDSRLEGTFEAQGVQFTPNDVLNAESLDVVTDDRAQDVRSAFEQRGGDAHETPATDFVKEVVKKKKDS